MPNINRASQLVTAYLSSTESVDAAASGLVSAKRSMLTSIQSALKGCPAIDEDTWTKDWAKPALDALIASGRYSVDDKGRSLSATVACSTLKIAVIALTNDYEVEADKDTSLKGFVSRVRPELAKDDLIEPSKAGAKRKTGDRKSTDREAQYAKAAFMVAGKDKARAKVLTLIMQEYADDFDAWADDFIIEQDAKIRTKRRGA